MWKKGRVVRSFHNPALWAWEEFHGRKLTGIPCKPPQAGRMGKWSTDGEDYCFPTGDTPTNAPAAAPLAGGVQGEANGTSRPVPLSGKEGGGKEPSPPPSVF